MRLYILGRAQLLDRHLKNSTTGPQQYNYCLSSINHLRVAYLIHYPENGGGVCSIEVEVTAVTLCHGKLNCWPINSVYRFYIQ